MNKRFLLALALMLPWLTSPSHAQVLWRVSIKVFTDKGIRPVNRTDAQIRDDYEYYNKLLAKYARGVQFDLTEIVALPASLNAWFNVPARNSGNRDALQTLATLNDANRALYAYRGDAINVYINNSSSGICCGPGNGLIFIGRDDDHITPVHEIGHMLGLAHTQGADCNNCCPDALGCCDTPGDDGIDDTILDLQCWNRDQVAQNNFFNTYANLNAGEQYQVDNVWLNIMSYHYGFFNNGLERLTPGQMDRAAEVSNILRGNVTIRRFRFVDSTAGNDGNNGLAVASSFRTIPAAVGQSGEGDSLQLRAGTYNKATPGDWVLADQRVLCSRGGEVRLTRE